MLSRDHHGSSASSKPVGSKLFEETLGIREKEEEDDEALK
jgi:hypothetical protein